MHRRTLLTLGLGGAALLAIVGRGIAMVRPGLEGTRLGPAGRELFNAVARAVLDGMLPTDDAERQRALDELLDRLDATIAGLPAATRAELSQLIALLGTPPGRLGLAGLASNWRDAGIAELQAAMQSMRVSSLDLRQQTYHALRDLICAAYFADARTWPLIGYPGPTAL